MAWRDHFPTPNCADRFDGDADGDVDVDNDDYLIWRSQFGFGQQGMMAGGGGGGEAQLADAPEGGWPTEEEMGITDAIKAKAMKVGNALDYAIKAALLPPTADADRDGDFDNDDLKIFDKLIPRQ